jgi:hypothetical protein
MAIETVFDMNQVGYTRKKGAQGKKSPLAETHFSATERPVRRKSTSRGAGVQNESEGENFLKFIDHQIATTKEYIERGLHKLAVLEELRRDYSAKPSEFTPSDGSRLLPRQQLATQAIATYLSHQKEPVPTTTLLRFLEEQGIKFGGRQPRNTLSVLLSRSKRFVAHGRRGWTIAEHEPAIAEHEKID